jgi:hypothetical protein
VPTKHSAVTAVQQLERSKLDPKTIQQELMGDDLDLEKLVVYLKSKIKFNAAERVLDVNITRTIEGASTVTIDFNDYERTILNSGVLNNALDIQLNGLWFRLVKVERQAGDTTLTLTFEDREIAVLRSYPKTGAPHNGVKFAHRSKTTRAEFILNLIREVKEFKIPVVIPELHKVQAIEKSADLSTAGRGTGGVTADTGIPKTVNYPRGNENINPRANVPNSPAYTLSVKGSPASPEQIKNANTIIAVGKSMGARRKVIVCAIMTAIVESTIHNLPGGDLDSVGLFQQRDNWGSYSDRHDPATASKLFFKQAISYDADVPNAPYWQVCADVQRPREDLRTRYNDYRIEAERFVTTAGLPGGDSEANVADVNLMDRSTWGTGQVADYVYYRGTPKEGGKVWTRENNWDCIQRLVSEVQWRAFFVSGVFYLLPEDDLFKTQPIMIIDETSQGVEGIGFDYDIGKKSATVSVPIRVGTWLAPPGAVVALQHCGPVSGRWIVSDFSRSLFDSKADVSLKKPMPVLPEPLTSDLASIPTWATNSGKAVAGGFDDPAQFGGIANTDGSRNAVVLVARKALELEQAGQHYAYPPDEGGDGRRNARPIPQSLFSVDAHNGLDCSAFATLCYKEAGASDPNGSNYNGTGNTGTLFAHCRRVVTPDLGDLVFYGGSESFPGHVAVYVGSGKVIEIGSANGILEVPIRYRTDLIGYASGFPF